MGCACRSLRFCSSARSASACGKGTRSRQRTVASWLSHVCASSAALTWASSARLGKVGTPRQLHGAVTEMMLQRAEKSIGGRQAGRLLEREGVFLLRLLQLSVLFGLVNSPKFLHVLLDVLLRLVFHILIALQVFGSFAVLQLLVHHSMGQLRGRGGENTETE